MSIIKANINPRRLASADIYPIGLGCMNLSHAYGHPLTESDGINILHRAIDLGVNHFDSAALYGFGRNESLLGKAFKGGLRQKIHLASKCGMTGVNGKRIINGRPETLKATIDASLQRLQTDAIDLYYLHRLDPAVPIEESVGAMADMVKAGKIKAVGLSEMSAETVRRAHKEHPIAALQTEYSLWSRNAEIAVLDVCQELAITFVAFSPLGRGFLANGLTDLNTLVEGDIRRGMPRFQQPAFDQNLPLLSSLNVIANNIGVETSQLALAWLLHKSKYIVPIPGTTSLSHLASNIAATEIHLNAGILLKIDNLINQSTVSGPRYPAATQAEIDTEEFDL